MALFGNDRQVGGSLRNKLLIALMFTAFIPACIIGVFYYVDSSRALEANTADSHVLLLTHILSNLDQQIEEVYKFTNWLYLDKDIVRLMQRSPEEAQHHDQGTIDAIKKIENQFRFMPLMEHVNAFLLLGDNGLDLRYGPHSFRIDWQTFNEEFWFLEGRQKAGELSWGCLTENFVTRSTISQIIPVYRNFLDIHGGKTLGSIILLLNPSFFQQTYGGMISETSASFFIQDAGGRTIYEDHCERAPDYSELLKQADPAPSTKITKDGRSFLVVEGVSPKSKSKITLVTGLEELDHQRHLIKNTTLLLAGGTIFLSLWFSLFLSRNLSEPIGKLTQTVDKIADGHFEQAITLHNNDEFGRLSSAITRMSQQIQRLLDERLQAEQEIRQTEIRLLQSQINPHFLHNTLNSIKWMATLQGAEGIKDMVTSLGRLLRAVMGNLNRKIPLREELALLEDYLHIQRIRYGGRLIFKLRVADQDGTYSLLDCLIPKFTLQPLVENAVFHGLEPKEGIGEIILSVSVKQERLKISVWDNGVGISPSKLAVLLDPPAAGGREDQEQSIGLRNVANRIRLIYGAEYGLTVESAECEYTEVVVFIPLEVADGAESFDCG